MLNPLLFDEFEDLDESFPLDEMNDIPDEEDDYHICSDDC